MTTVTGLTAERMLEIEAGSVVDGNVVADELILVKHDGSTINAGNVKGDTGAVGPMGYDTSPIGSVITHTSQTIPSEYLLANGQTVSEDNYPQLAAFAATEVAASNPNWGISGSAPHRTITIPNLADRFIFSKGSKTFGSKSGEETHLLTGAESGVNGNGVTSSNGTHHHNIPGTRDGEPADPGASHVVERETVLVAYGWNTDDAGAHTHSLTSRAADTAHNNMPPYCVLAFLVKAKGVSISSGTIVGPPGPQGDAGPVGPAGPQGPQGDPDPSAISKNLFDAKGDLIGASADNTPARVPAGAEGSVLVQRASAASGNAFEAAAPQAVTLVGDVGKKVAVDPALVMEFGNDLGVGQTDNFAVDTTASFLTNSVQNYNGGGGSTVTTRLVSGGKIRVTVDNAVSFQSAGHVYDSRVSLTGDCEAKAQMVGSSTGSSSNWVFRVGLGFQTGDGKSILAEYRQDGVLSFIVQNGEAPEFPGGGSSSWPTSAFTNRYLGIKRQGNLLTATLYDTDGVTVLNTATVTLTGATATRFGAGTSGYGTLGLSHNLASVHNGYRDFDNWSYAPIGAVASNVKRIAAAKIGTDADFQAREIVATKTFSLPIYTTTTMPNAAAVGDGKMIFVSNAAAGSRVQVTIAGAWVGIG